MKAARFYDRNDIRIEDIPAPKVAPVKYSLRSPGAAFAAPTCTNTSTAPSSAPSTAPAPHLG